MKKLLLALACSGFSFGAFAQSNFTIIDGASNNVVGTTQTYTVTNGTLDTRLFTVNNVSGNAVNVKVRKTILVLNDAASQAYFCTDQNCYSPSQSLSYQVSMSAGGSFVLTTDYVSNVTGVSQVRYTVFNLANTADSSSFVISYNSTPTGISSPALVKASVSNPMPNPASSAFSLNYKLGSNGNANARIVIYNMLGANVLEMPVSDAEGTVRMDVSTLDAGVYFCSLESDGKTLATRRLVVSH